jgi:hypothetical protein
MYNQDHWLSDVALGDALAIMSVNSVSKWLAKTGKGMGGLQWQIMPVRQGVGLSVVW